MPSLPPSGASHGLPSHSTPVTTDAPVAEALTAGAPHRWVLARRALRWLWLNMPAWFWLQLLLMPVLNHEVVTNVTRCPPSFLALLQMPTVPTCILGSFRPVHGLHEPRVHNSPERNL